MLTISELGLRVIKHYESLHDGDLSTIGLQPKMDPSQIWTEGWGHAILDKTGNFVKGLVNKALAYSLAKVKTKEEAEALLLTDLKSRIASVNARDKVFNQWQFDALVSFVYNCGSGKLGNLLLKLQGLHRTEDIEAAFEAYSYSAGKQLLGLLYRRRTEGHLYATGEVKFYN